jgi:hypothetical protein
VFDRSGQPVNPLQSNGAKALVFVFLSVECPISNSYAPELKRLAAEFKPCAVTFRYVYPNPNETAEIVEKHAREYGYGLDDTLRDPQHELAKAAGVRVTPEVGLFVPGRGFVYRGRIDDRIVAFGQARIAPTQRNLRDALRAIVERKPILVPVTRAVGCDISEPP